VGFRTAARESRRRGPKHARPRRGPTLVGALLAIGALAVVAGLVTVVTNAAKPQAVNGHAQPVPTATTTRRGTSPVPPPRTHDDWTTLSNPASGLSYQIPPANWSTNPQVGTVGSVTLAQGAERTAYTCGTPPERLLRGVLGSGSAPRTTPVDVASAAAQTAAVEYYSTNGTPPRVTVDSTQPVLRRTRAGATLTGVLLRATVTQHADPCLASQGEILVFVLQFPDHDGVLLVNADVAGGPAQPAPATDGELRSIVDTARPTN
jgi:hypothetical protein